MSKYLWSGSAVVFALFFFWRFAASGAAHELVSASGFALVSPYLWLRPIDLFRPIRAELETAAARLPPPAAVGIAGGIGFAMILVGAAWRWFAA